MARVELYLYFKWGESKKKDASMRNYLKKSVITFGFVLVVSQSALASLGGFFVEPMLTYERGEIDIVLPSPFNSSNSTARGFGLGARFGVQIYESGFFGVDARYSRPTYTNKDTEVDSSASSYNYGPVVGLQMATPLIVRIWAGYIAGGEMDVQRDGEIDFKFKSGSGYRIGGGVKLYIISLNLEYQNIEYDETQLSDASIFTGSTDNVYQKNKSLVLSVSVPISL